MSGPSIANQTPAETYTNLLLAGDNGKGLSTTPLQLQDGIGNQAPMFIATNAINFDRAQGEFQLDGVALTATAATLNSLTNFSTAQYIVYAPNAQLPQAFQLLASNGIELNNVGSTLTIQPANGSELYGLQALNTTGIMVRDAAGTYTTVDLQTNATLQLTNGAGIGGNPTLGVISDTNVQRVNIQENGILQVTSSQLNFLPGLNTGITIQNDAGNNRANITITASAIQTFFVKSSCQAATTANLNATYNNGVSGVGATLTNAGALAAFSTDGYNANLNDRVLVKDQTAPTQNGIYDVTTVGNGAVAWVLTRASDFNSPSTIQSGDFTNILNGTININTAWLETDTVNVVGTDPIEWTKFGFGGSVTNVSGTAGQIDVANGNTTPVISIDPAYVGQNSITTLGTITTGIWHGSIIDLAHGGSNANLVASNGGIIYSNATQMQILAGTATANQVLLSGLNTAPSWSTATYPASTTINQLLYSSAANTIAGLATANSATLITSSTGVPSFTASMTNGQILIGSTGATPIPATLTQGSGVTITNGAGTITIAATGSGGTVTSVSGTAGQITVTNPTTTPTIAIDATYVGQASITTLGTISTGVWNGTAVDVSHGGTGNSTFTAYSVICAGTTATGVFQNVVGVGSAGQVLTSAGASALPTWSNPGTGLIVNQNTSSVTMVAGTQYYINNGASLVTLTLPSSAAVGDTFYIIGGSSGGWTIAQQVGQTIHFDGTATTAGVGGSLSSTGQYQNITIKCITANTTFTVFDAVGSITVV